MKCRPIRIVVLIAVALFVCGCQEELISLIDEGRHGLSSSYIAAMSVDPDIDEDEPGGDVHLDADIGTGSGFAVAYDLQDVNGFGLSVLFMGTSHNVPESHLSTLHSRAGLRAGGCRCGRGDCGFRGAL
jgi:hypothetical protein